jgi:hypothetical protein
LRKTSSRHLSGNFLLSKCSPKQVLWYAVEKNICTSYFF